MVTSNPQYNEIWKKYPELAISPSAKHRVRIIKSLIKKADLDINILDIGCGTCTLLDSLSKDGYKNLYGMDIAGDAFCLIPDNLKNNITLIIGDITNKESLPDNKFNIIVCSEILEHIQEDVLALNNIKTILAKEGKLIISVPYDQKYWTKHDEAAGHVRRYDKNELEAKLVNSGYTIEKSFIWGWPHYFIYWQLILSKINPNTVWKNKGTFKNLVSWILYQIFKIDDLFTISKKGMRLFIMANNNSIANIVEPDKK